MRVAMRREAIGSQPVQPVKLIKTVEMMTPTLPRTSARTCCLRRRRKEGKIRVERRKGRGEGRRDERGRLRACCAEKREREREVSLALERGEEEEEEEDTHTSVVVSRMIMSRVVVILHDKKAEIRGSALDSRPSLLSFELTS